jgi:glyoxylase-like metal-dependent hydrolase (beta-lactamase superfamily II)
MHKSTSQVGIGGYSRCVVELPGGMWRVTMPLPTRPGHVHCYLLPVEDGLMLVDTGLGLPDARERWAEELAALDVPVSTIFLTHFHPDHIGAAQDLRDLTGARVVEGRIDAEQAALVWGDDAWSEVLAEWFHRNGVPASVTDELLGQGKLYRPLIRTVPDPDVVEAGDRFHGWELVAAPGHADGQLSLLRGGVLIAADHLLDPISPAVGLWPESRPDPLGDYLDSLRRTIDLAPEVAYGGHGAPMADPVGRARELIEHHAERLRQAAAALGPEPRTGYEVSFPLFGDSLQPAARRFAVAETLSHLERLVVEGRAERWDAQLDGDVVGVSYTAAQ